MSESKKGTPAGDIKKYPVSTYRLQFSRDFTFQDAADLVPYLYCLGITDVYASPYMESRPGSLHGYDIVNHNKLDPEVGSESEYGRFVDALHRHGMGQLLDFVPNHMSIFNNPWWNDVLQNGPASPYAAYFDIDWHPLKPELENKVLLPILEDQYGRVLESGNLRLGFNRGTFHIHYHRHQFPVDAKGIYPLLLSIKERLGDKAGGWSKILDGILAECQAIPGRDEAERADVRRRALKELTRELRSLYKDNEQFREAMAAEIALYNSGGHDRLHELLDRQAYRLAYWRVAADEINYRRFFDINSLIGLRMENPELFEESHRLVRKLLAQGSVTGLRIDHIDGLYNPQEYLRRLQNARQADFGGRAPDNPLFLVVEKILSEGETLQPDWPVNGTTGYEFGAVVGGLFVNRRNALAIRKIYSSFTRNDRGFNEIIIDTKNLVMNTALTSELTVLAHELDEVSESSRWTRDFTFNSLRDGLREVIACFPVYRTYIDAASETVRDEDRAIILSAVNCARRHNPAVGRDVFNFIRDILLLKYADDMSEQARSRQGAFVMHFQQITGPVMAKGVEDTAFYRYNPLVSLNEVGGSPQKFGYSVEEFHLANLERKRNWPHSLLATTTHDSKRSEDVRARISVISEIPKEWHQALGRWSRANQSKKTRLEADSAPDRNEEYLIYQTLLGTLPEEDLSGGELESYIKRIEGYIVKALREAKVHSSWVDPDLEYESTVRDFIIRILDTDDNSFMGDFRQLNRLAVACGRYNSLSQVVLKVFSPGTPDIYRGQETWDLSLVDPDNRRPVDFASLSDALESLQTTQKEPSEFVGGPKEEQLKLYVTWKSLCYRRDKRELFDDGKYLPVEAAGPRRSNVCAFRWKGKTGEILVAVPRLIAGLTRKGSLSPTDATAWGDTSIELPGRSSTATFRSIFTRRIVEGARSIAAAEVFKDFPVAVLERI